jgi:hypothetical protein
MKYLLTPKNVYKRIRKSLIENKIHKLNEVINEFSKQGKLPCPEADNVERKKRDLIDEYNHLDN